MTATPTGKNRRHHVTREKAPVIEVARPWGGLDDGDVVTVDGTAYYYFEVAGESGLFREAVAVDAGGNEIRRRAAPGGLRRFARPVAVGHPPLTVVGDGLAYWVRGS